MCLATPAMAQTTPEDSSGDAIGQNETAFGPSENPDAGLIVVTGSRIARREFDTAAPTAVVQDEEFKLSGAVNVENVINTLPQVVPGTTSFSNNPGGGVATLDLRGLGATRTLVLVNGRRYMFFDTSQLVDLNTIPQFLIDSVDVVTGGASAVYGSDAISGVVNFNLRQDLVGVEAGGQYSLTGEGDGARYNAYIALGSDLADGRGHATVFAEYYNRSSVFQGDRDFSFFALGDGANGLVPGGSSTLPSGVLRNFGGAQGTLPSTGAFAQNDAVVFDTPGTFRPRNGDLYNYAPANYLMVPQERYLLGGYANYQISDGVEAYLEATFVNNRVANELAATPVTGDFNVNLAAVQPFLNPASYANLVAMDAGETAANAAAGNTDDPGVVNLFVQRRVTETGSRNSLDERNAFRVMAGLRGNFLDNRLQYDMYYSYARTRNANIQAGNISRSAFQAGLDGSAPAINIFGPNTLTPAMVDQISILAQNGDVSVLQVASGSISGSLFNLGMGADDVGFAVGTEYRKVASEFIPDTALSSGDVIGFNGGDPTQGGYDVKEVFAELRVPVARWGDGGRLELTGAARYSDYSLPAVGGVWTYAAGAELAPIRDVTLRGQYQRAIRAPNVGELFGGQANGFPNAVDPCSNRQPTAQQTATVRQLCVQSGVPAGNVFGNIQLNTQIEGVFGGNPNLQEERSDSYTFGAVLRPRFIPGLFISADYFNIEVDNTISTFGGGLNNTLDLCYNQIQDINSVYCQAVVGNRSANGSLAGGPNALRILNANIGKLETAGIDVQVSYSTEIPFSLFTDTGEQRMNLSFLGTWLDKYNVTPVAELPDTINECAGKFGQLACGTPLPEYKWASRASFIDGPITTSVRWRHIGSTTDDNPQIDYFVEKLDSVDYIDLSFAATVSDNLELALGVNNLFNTFPQQLGDNQEQANTYPGVYDVLGRDYFVSARLVF
nr:TonB-dependent receptor [Novosphingopyxis sp. YJ-S2-01]